MKKNNLALGLVLLGLVVFILQGCRNNIVKEIFQKEWKTMSNEDKMKLEKLFKEDGYADSTEYWVLCSDEGGDTLGRVNPWLTSAQAKPIEMNLYIDNSTSMKGYFMSDNLSPLVSVISGIQQLYAEDKMAGYYIENGNLKEYPIAQLTNDITHKKLSGYSDAFQLDGLFATILSNYKSRSKNKDIIDFIITDGIPSGTNEDIRTSKNRRFNINSASLLQTRIATAFNGVKGVAASVYQFTSGFNGDYWFYDNLNPQTRNWQNRPFYVVVIGSKKLVMDLAEKENNGLENFKAVQKVHFGAVDKDNVILTGPFKNGTTVDPTEFKEAEDEDGYNGTITIYPQLQLSGIPYFARNAEYLKKNMDITFNGKKMANSEWKVEGKMLTITMKVQQYETYKLKIKIKNATPSWVVNANCSDDRKISNLELSSKTFNLKFLVEGLKNGVTGCKGDVILLEKDFEISTDAEEN